MEGKEQQAIAALLSPSQQEEIAAETAISQLNPLLQPCFQHLLSLQKHRNTVYSAFKQELQALDSLYSRKFEPLYAQRRVLLEQYQLISGFWLQVMKKTPTLRDYVFPQDELALRYLLDIELKEGENRHDFQLLFRFQENPYIADSVLTKTFAYDDKGEILRGIGSEIHWKGDNLTQKKVKTKRARKGKTTMTVKSVPTFSFFTFFESSTRDNLENSDSDREDAGPQHLQMVEDDEEIGQAIREEAIPNALLYYCGVRGEDSESEEDSGEDLETIPESLE